MHAHGKDRTHMYMGTTQGTHMYMYMGTTQATYACTWKGTGHTCTWEQHRAYMYTGTTQGTHTWEQYRAHMYSTYNAGHMALVQVTHVHVHVCSWECKGTAT